MNLRHSYHFSILEQFFLSSHSLFMQCRKFKSDARVRDCADLLYTQMTAILGIHTTSPGSAPGQPAALIPPTRPQLANSSAPQNSIQGRKTAPVLLNKVFVFFFFLLFSFFTFS